MRLTKASALVAVAVVFLLTPLAAKADTVTYVTTGCFGLGCSAFSSSATTPPGLTFTGVSATVSAPTFGSLGHFQLPATSGSLSGISFALQVAQSIPTVGTDVFSAMLTGSFTSTSSGAFAVFNNPTFSLGNVTYSLLNGGVVAFPAPSSGGGADLVANITAAPVPEPSALALLGVGLIALALVTKQQKFRTSTSS